MSPSVSIRLLLTQSDARLVELARDGHERAFEALVQRYRRPLLNYCRRLLLPSERAEDALQQGLVQAWLALRDGCEVRHAKAWLYRIVHNSALNALRSSSYDYVTLSETLRGADAPESDLDRRVAVREALAGLAALPEMQREALLRTAVDGHSHEQVARALGLTEGALRGLVYRARAALRTATTALTPPQVVNWALSPRTGASLPTVARLGEAGAGGGSLGLGGILTKGGAVAITAGALAGGAVAVHRAAHRLSPAGSRIVSAGGPLSRDGGPQSDSTAVRLASERVSTKQVDAGRRGRRRTATRDALGLAGPLSLRNPASAHARARARTPELGFSPAMHVGPAHGDGSGDRNKQDGSSPGDRLTSGAASNPSGSSDGGRSATGGSLSTGKDGSSTDSSGASGFGTQSSTSGGDGSSSNGSGSDLSGSSGSSLSGSSGSGSDLSGSSLSGSNLSGSSGSGSDLSGSSGDGSLSNTSSSDGTSSSGSYTSSG